MLAIYLGEANRVIMTHIQKHTARATRAIMTHF